jgi:iron uptake system EfeUOB component EfeO/EfeM
LRRRHRYFLVAIGVVLVVTTVMSMTAGYRYAGATCGSATAWQRAYATHAVPSPQVQAATLSATQAFRREVVTAAEAFASDTAALDAAIARGDLAVARRNELAAQSQWDVLRPVLALADPSLTPFDALVSDQNPAYAPQGLHAIERALWLGSLTSARSASARLASQSAYLPFAVYRTILTPSEICAKLDESLGWTVENAIDQSQERYSHLDIVDVKAATRAAETTVVGLTPVGRLVAPGLTGQLVRDLDRLIATTSATTTSSTDASIAPTTWTRIAQEMDVLQLDAGELGGALSGLGTGRNYA